MSANPVETVTCRYVSGMIQSLTSYRARNREGVQNREGLCKFWHDNGQFEGFEFYRDGIAEGESKIWAFSGLVMYHLYYMNSHAIDREFNHRKKSKLCMLKRRLYFGIQVSAINTFLISDLWSLAIS